MFDRKRDVGAPEQVLDEKTVGMMNFMLSQVPERGTGRAAKLQGIKTAGKTGTTNAYRDAWFMGFTGNFVGGVWFGNDDFTSTNKMTGGSLPAQTWNRVMTYAHSRRSTLKPIPYLDAPTFRMASDPPPESQRLVARVGHAAACCMSAADDGAARSKCRPAVPRGRRARRRPADRSRSRAADAPDRPRRALQPATGRLVSVGR